ncbi:MAG: N-formylglutamate amidohydrolase [Pseudomonadota bacterium]
MAAADLTMSKPTAFPSSPPPEAAFERVRADSRPEVLLICDHATNAVPSELGDLGLSAEDRERHIAYDIGVRGVVLALSDLLDAPAVLSTFSRLVIDPNRGETDPTILMRLYDRSIIPGNAQADAAERERRLETYHRPYHNAVSGAIDRAMEAGARPLLVSIHSFTPQLRGKEIRPWHAGVLWDQDEATARALLHLLNAEGDLCVGDNEPYRGSLEGDTMWRHGNSRNLPHALIEIRHDLIREEDQQWAWANRLAPMLEKLLEAAASP